MMKLKIENSLMSLISVAKYSSPILGVFVILFGVELNENSCLIPYLQGVLPSCPVILWPYFLGAALIVLGIVLWALPILGFFQKGAEQNEEVALPTSYQG